MHDINFVIKAIAKKDIGRKITVGMEIFVCAVSADKKRVEVWFEALWQNVDHFHDDHRHSVWVRTRDLHSYRTEFVHSKNCPPNGFRFRQFDRYMLHSWHDAFHLFEGLTGGGHDFPYPSEEHGDPERNSWTVYLNEDQYAQKLSFPAMFGGRP
jgi:hypothetical protein